MNKTLNVKKLVVIALALIVSFAMLPFGYSSAAAASKKKPLYTQHVTIHSTVKQPKKHKRYKLKVRYKVNKYDRDGNFIRSYKTKWYTGKKKVKVNVPKYHKNQKIRIYRQERYVFMGNTTCTYEWENIYDSSEVVWKNSKGKWVTDNDSRYIETWNKSTLSFHNGYPYKG